MPDYNSAFTGAQIDARLTLAGTAQQPPAEGPFVDGDKTKLDGIDTTNATINDHIADDANPHGVTKAQVGLSNVDNTSDSNKPISTAQAAVNAVLSTPIAEEYAGTWDASSGSFPAGSARGEYYIVSVAGTVDGQTFAEKDWLIPLVASASTSTFAANWTRGDYSQVLPSGLPKKYYTSVASLLLDTTTFNPGDTVKVLDNPAVYTATNSTGNLGQANAGSQEFDVYSITADVRAWGALGDGSTDDTDAINNAIIAVNAIGGGTVWVPETSSYYETTDYVRLLDNVYLKGNGYASHIRNVATSGFAKVVIASGNVGDPVNLNSMFEETGYDLLAVARGDFEVEFVTGGDAGNFSVGEIVGIQSNETWSTVPSPNDKGKWLNQNEITAINGATITLRYAVPDDYTSSAGNRPTIHRLGGVLNGYDGTPNFMAKNCGASNLRLTQSTGLGSGWYAIFPSGINQLFENLWMDNCSSLIGSNNLSYSTFRNIQGAFEAGFMDFAEWQNNNLIENVIGYRFAANALLNRIGLSSNKGTDMIFRNVIGHLDGWGKFSQFQVHRGVFERCRVIGSGSASDTGSTEAILLGYGDDCEAFACEVLDQYVHGIQVISERGRVTQCHIPATNSGSYAVYSPAGLDVAFVQDNIFGVEGSINSRDRFFQQIAQSPTVYLKNNQSYNDSFAKSGQTNTATSAQTSGATLTTLRTASLKGTSGITRGFRVVASGVRSGTAGTKAVTLNLGATTLATVSYAAPDTGAWRLETVINVRTETNALHCISSAYNGTTLQANASAIIASGLVSDVDLTVKAQCADAADVVALYQFIVEPI